MPSDYPLTQKEKEAIEAMYFASVSIYVLDNPSPEAVAYYNSLFTSFDF